MKRSWPASRQSAELDETLAMHGLERFAARKKIVARLGRKGLGREDRAACARRAARRPLERGDRAVPHRPVVRQRARTGEAGDCRRARRQDQIRPAELGKHLFQLDGEHPALVHLAPALVGASNSGLVRTRDRMRDNSDESRAGMRAERWNSVALERRSVKAAKLRTRSRSLQDISVTHPDARTGKIDRNCATRTCSTPGSPPRCGRSRRWAGRTRRRSLRASIRPRRWSPASTSSSSGSRA